MSPRLAFASACVAIALAAAAGNASAQDGGPLSLDPPVAGEATGLVASVDASVLAPDGRSVDSITFALPRGTRFDATAVKRLCRRSEAACPDGSHIGFGRFKVVVRNFAWWGGEAELAWSLTASLAKPLRRGDAASVVLTSSLLGADYEAGFLGPALGAGVPATTTTTGRLVRRPSGLELRLAQLPVRLDVAAPVTAAASGMELSLSAVRRTRRDFIRRVRVRTLSGYEVRKIPDHTLVGHYLLQAPRACGGSWAAEIRAGAGRQRSAIPCAKR